MIIEYHRPTSIEDALTLLARPDHLTYPLGGGTFLNRPLKEQFAVVDLQELGLSQIHKNGNQLVIGSTAPLQSLLDFDDIPQALRDACRREASYNIRQVSTVAGTLVSANGRSSLTALILAMDASLTFLPDRSEVSLGDWLPVRLEGGRGKLITQVSIPLNIQAQLATVSRTPADLPLIIAAVVRWTSGRTRVVVGGYGKAPIMVLDGPGPDGAEEAARNAFAKAGDEWASSDYRQVISARLVHRLLSEIP